MKKFLKIFYIVFFTLALLSSKASAAPTWVHKIDITSEEDRPNGFTFNNDGTKMFVIGHKEDEVIEYTLSTAWNVSTYSLVDSFSTKSESGYSRDVKFSQDGTKMFVLGGSANGDEDGLDSVCEYTLSTGFDVSSTVTFIDCTSVHPVGAAEELGFSQDGTKMFVLDQTGNDVNEFKLTTGFDISTASYVQTFSVDDQEDDPTGLAFTYDGTKMFVTGFTGDDINEYTLSTAFDVSTASFVDSFYMTDGSYGIRETYPTSFAFSSDGSKLFTLGREWDEVQEWTLSCYYGVVNCMDPTSDKDDVASVEAQTEVAKKLIQHTTYPILNRMEWLRRNTNNSNLTNQNIKFQFSNTILESLSNLIKAWKYDNTAYLNNEAKASELKANNWSFWSEGTVSFGKTGDSITSFAKRIKTSAITIGADRRADNSRMVGLAIRLGNDDINIYNAKSSLDLDTVNLTLYESRLHGEDKFIDSLIGIGTFKTDIVNAVGFSSTEGERDGTQVFGSFKIRETFQNNELNFTPNIKIDLGFTSLSDYQEDGTANLKFDRQRIGTIITSIGGAVENSANLKIGTLKPFLEIDYYADISPSSHQKISYISDGSTYTLSNINSSTHNFKGKLGYDFITDTGWFVTSSYQRTQNKGNGHSNGFYFAARNKPSKDIEYAMSLDNDKTFLDYKRNINGFDFTVGSNYSLFSEIPDYAASLKISNTF